MRSPLPDLFPQPRSIRIIGEAAVPVTVAPDCRSDPSLPAEGYLLELDASGIRLAHSDEAGRRHGLATLEQLRKHPYCPSLRIEDAPDLRQRGFMLDISRCRVPRRWQLEQLVDLLAALKFNQLQLYTEHTFAYPGHELVWGASSPMTPGDIHHIDRYCRQRGIELVPNQNSFGHMERWLKYPQYHDLAECPDGFVHPVDRTRGRVPNGSVLQPGKKSLDFMESLYDDLLPHFTSGMLHAGCDETWELGQGASRERVAREGKERVYLQFLLQLHKLVEGKGRRMLFWADMLQEHPEFFGEIPPDLIPVAWGYERKHPFPGYTAALAASGLEFLVAPGTSDWDSYSGRLDNTLENITAAVRAAIHSGAAGCLLASWGDRGHQQAWPLIFPGLVQAGCLAWNARAQPDLQAALTALPGMCPSTAQAGALLALGRIENGWIAEDRNHSVNRWLLRDNPLALRMELDLTGPEPLRKGIQGIHAIRETLGPVDPADPRPSVSRDLRLACDFCECAYRRGLFLLGSDDGRGLAASLQSLIGRFESNWLLRFRPGGLSESTGLLRDTLQSLLRR
jgi:hypothetical protein